MKKSIMLFILVLLVFPMGVISCPPSYVELGLHITTKNCESNANLRYKVYVQKDELPEEYALLLSSSDEWVDISGLTDLGSSDVNHLCDTVFDYYGLVMGNSSISSFYLELYDDTELISTSPRYSNDIIPIESDIWEEKQQYRIVYDIDTGEFSLVEDDFRHIFDCPGAITREEFVIPVVVTVVVITVVISIIVMRRRDLIDK